MSKSDEPVETLRKYAHTGGVKRGKTEVYDWFILK